MRWTLNMTKIVHLKSTPQTLVNETNGGTCWRMGKVSTTYEELQKVFERIGIGFKGVLQH